MATRPNSPLKQGDLPAFKVGSDWRFSRETIEEWAKKQATARVV
jgi:hypothetical protein